jgi:nitroreductase
MGDTLHDIKARRSIRSFKAEPVKEPELSTVLEAATWAANGRGAQSAKIVFTQKTELIQEVEKLNAAVLGNPDAKPFFGTPCLVVVFADTTVPTWIDDGNQVIATMMLAAQAIGIGSCFIYRARESFESPGGKALMKQWGLSDNYKAVGNVILGYPAGTPPEAAARKEGRIIKV